MFETTLRQIVTNLIILKNKYSESILNKKPRNRLNYFLVCFGIKRIKIIF